jgi:hypothetical protein
MQRALRADSPHGLRRRLRACGAGLALACGLAASGPAAAQHPAGPRARAFHERLGKADAVAVATVKSVEPGRLRMDEVRSLHGDVPSPFQAKRAPGAPPPLAAGDRVLLLLRGARPPYVLVDAPDETIRLADSASEERWSAAVLAWLAVRERPEAWVPLYLSWIDAGPDTLRELAVKSLGDPAAPFQPLRPEVFAGLGAAAWDPARSLAARRAASQLAFLDTAGGEALAAGFLRAEDADPVVSQAALRVAPRLGPARGSSLLLRGLDHRDAEVRRTALRAARGLGAGAEPALRDAIARLAQDPDVESWLRADAAETIAALPAVAGASGDEAAGD